MRLTKAEKARLKAEGLTRLRALLKRGDRIYTVLRHVSKSGMYRVIALYVVKRGEIHWITRSACWALGDRWDDRHEGLGVGGCGSDVGHDTVMHLSYALHGWGKQTPTGQYILTCKCEGKPYPHRCYHKPGYTLRHEWL